MHTYLSILFFICLTISKTIKIRRAIPNVNFIKALAKEKLYLVSIKYNDGKIEPL